MDSNFFLFLGAFIVTIFFVYVTTPHPHTVYKFPTPETADGLIYQKKTGSCYKYNHKVVPCPSNPKVL